MRFIGTRCVSENPDKIQGHYWSSKMKAAMPYRNELARDCMRAFDFEHSVTEYRARPFAIEFYQGEELCKFIPDLIAVRDGKTQLVYCQEFENWQTEVERIGLGLATVWCMERGCELMVITRNMLPQVYLDNVRLLSRFADFDLQEGHEHAVLLMLLTADQPVTIQDLVDGLLSWPTAEAQTHTEEVALSVLFCMAYRHMIALPIRTEVLSPETRARLPDGPGTPALAPIA